MLFRKAKESDLAGIDKLAKHSGIGITTLPKNIHTLKEKLAWSHNSFQKKEAVQSADYFLFVLEDPNTGEIVGTSAIKSTIGADAPFYSYKVCKRTRICHSLSLRDDSELLVLVNDNQENSEMCTLFLEPTYRKNSNGILLSRARFLFMAQFPLRFSPTIIAEMRGVSDEAGHTPFWDHVGKHFFHMSFKEADRLTLSTNKQFIADLMPSSPIYVKLLHPEAQAVIGEAHHTTIPAMRILMKEGFHYNNYVDIFDAGPTIEASRDTIKTVQHSELLTITEIRPDIQAHQRLIIANTSLDFRATAGHALWNSSEKTCVISKETASLLQLEKDSQVRLIPLHLD